MKKNLFTLLALIFVCPFFSLAQKVTKEEASELAEIVFKKHNSGKLTNTKEIIPLGSTKKSDKEIPDTLLYIVPFEKGGYAIITADKGTPPYLGYCPKGDFKESDLPPGLVYLLEKYKSKIIKIRKEKKPQGDDIKQQWKEIYDSNQLKSTSSNVAPMLDTEWGQQGGFNDLCPNDYAGCTAIAMAQILRYWECKVDPNGSLTYTWPNAAGGSANFGATTYQWLDMDDEFGDDYNEVLIYHAGVSCKTKYKSNSSTSVPGRARDGFVNYWGISSSADVKWRMWHLNTWKDMLIDELHDGRPILYSAGGIDCEIGDGDGVFPGHSWVIDGITVDHRKFWCNWGWYGEHNGWYELGDFKPDDDNYNQMESAIFNVEPIQSNGVGTPQLSSQSFIYNPNGYTLSVPAAYGATSYDWTTSTGTISGNGTSVTLNAESTANIQVRAYNSVCNIYSPYNSATITVNYGPISAPDIICYSNHTVSIQNVPANTTVTWGGSNVSYPYGNTGTSVTVKAASSSTSGEGTITASFTVNNTLHTIAHPVWVGDPAPSEVSLSLYTSGGSPVTFMCSNTHYHIYVNNTGGCSSSNYNWSIPSGWSTNYTYNNMISVYTGSSPGGMVEVYANTCCSTNEKIVTDYFGSGYCGYSMVMSPNPTSGETTITIEEGTLGETTQKSASTDPAFDENVEWELEVYDAMQSLKEKKAKIKGKSAKIQTHNWKEGVYMVRALYKDQVLTGKLVVKK